MPTTLADVAAYAGVSAQTVSNALNRPELLRPDTLERVRSAVEALGYTPNAAARRLRQQRSSTIGLRIAGGSESISTTLLDRFLHELAGRAARVDKHIVLFAAESEEEEIAQILSLRDRAIADDFLIASTHAGDARIGALLDADVSFVAFGRPWGSAPEHHWVDVDGREGTRQATNALLDAGRTRVGFLGWPEGSASGDDRRAGWAEVMRERLGLRDADLTTLTARAENEIADAIGPATTLLDARVDAVVCASDSLASGAVAAASPRGVRLPIVGFDNTPFAAGIGFSSVDQNLGEVAEAVLAAFDAPSATTTIVRPRLEARSDARWGLTPADAGQ